MKKIVFSFLLAFNLYFFFNIKEVNTIDEVALIYDKTDLYKEDYHKVSFYDFNVSELDKIFKDLDIEIISVKPIENKYYKDSLNKNNAYDLISEYKNILLNKNYEDASIYYSLHGFKIESMIILCTHVELDKLEKRVNII